MTTTFAAHNITNELIDNLIAVIGEQTFIDYLLSGITPEQLTSIVEGILEAEGLELQ